MGFAVLVDAKVVYRDLFAFVDISHSMDRVSFDVLVTVLLCVVIAGVVNTAYSEKYPTFTSVGLKGEGVCSNDPEIMLSSIPIYVDIVHREEGSPLVFAEGIDLLADGCP
jgi:hypothetical protein